MLVRWGLLSLFLFIFGPTVVTLLAYWDRSL